MGVTAASVGWLGLSVVVKVDMFGAPLVRRQLSLTSERIDHMEPVLLSLAGDLRHIMGRTFDQRGFPTGQGWRPLSVETKVRKARDKNPKVAANFDKVLVATERLKNSLSVKGHPDQIEHVTDNMLEFSTSVPYAEFHNRGTRHMARRPIARLRESDRKKMTRKVERWLRHGVL